MSGASHTPGPWGVNCSHVYAPDGAILATVRNPGSKASDYPLVANRNLMAAAPELLEALEFIVSDSVSLEEAMAVSRAAIAKARGAQ